MKFIGGIVFGGVWALSSVCGWATAVGVGHIEQPVNLCDRSDPTRIPLGPVGVESNHGYGIHQIIMASRACPTGAMEWSGGSELDQNLARVFGISVEPDDSTYLLGGTCILRLKAWKKPEYSPYTKEQALAATLWCLIRSSGSSDKRPLTVKVVAEADEDKPLGKKFSGQYVLKRDEKGKVVGFPDVPGTRLEKDPRGFTWVVFPDVKPLPDFKPIQPVMIPIEMGGESGDAGWKLSPIWGSGKMDEPLELNVWSAQILYNCFYGTGVRDANAFSHGAYRFYATRHEKEDEVSVMYPEVSEIDMEANVLALVLSTQPTVARPLTIELILQGNDVDKYAKWIDEAGWKKEIKDENHRKRISIKTEFVWDPKKGELVKGAVPHLSVEDDGWVPMR